MCPQHIILIIIISNNNIDKCVNIENINNIDNNNNSQAFQLIVLARYLLGVPKP